MKKHLIYLIPFFVAVLFACERKDDSTSAGKDLSDVVFYATYEDVDPDTRTILQSDGSIQWDAHEEISIMLGDKSARFVSSNSEPAAKVEFHGSLEGFQYSSGDSFWAVYPYSQFNQCNGTTVSVNVPTLQTAKDGTFERDYFVSVARRADFNLYFANVCGGIRFVVNTPGIDKVTIHARGGESPTGTVTIAIENKVPVIKSISASEPDLEVFAPGGKTFTPGVAYYAVVIPQVYSKGFDFIFHAGSKKATTWINKSLTVKRGIFGTVTDIDKGLYFKDVPTSGNISFADDNLKAALVAAYDTNGDGELSYTEADAVTSISSSVFGSNKNYTSFDEFQYFTSVRSIPAQLFKGWVRMTSITLPESINSIGYEAFSGCTRMETVHLGNLLQTINYGAFQSCSSLEEVVLPNSLTTIGAYSTSNYDHGVFEGCTGLKRAVIGNSLEIIQHEMFKNCTSLESLTIGDGVKRIEKYAFYGCRSLKNISWGKNLTVINNEAFKQCTGLETLDITSPLEYIGGEAFLGCTYLTTLKLPNTLITIYADAFKNCTHLKSVDFGTGVTQINYGAFQNCSSLTEVVLPNSLRVIGAYSTSDYDHGVFEGCTGLKRAVIGSSLENIGHEMFKNCTSLSSITIGQSLASVGPYAFSNCTALTSINFENSSLKTVGDWAFYKCTNLDSVKFGDKLTSLGSYVFNNCGIRYLTLPATLQKMGSYIFRYCSGFSTLTMLAELPPTIGTNVFSYTNDNYSIVVPHDSLLRYREAWSSYASHIIASN